MSRPLIFGSISFRLDEYRRSGDDGCVDISFRKLVSNNSTTTSLPCLPIQGDSLVASDGAPRLKNSYNNIIEQLEKKYSHPILLQNNTNDSDEEDEEDDNEDNEDGNDDKGDADNDDAMNETIIEGVAGALVNKKKRLRVRDTYDMSDSFIDDEEACKEVESAYRSKKSSTKHTGFFVNSGALELITSTEQGDEVTDDNIETSGEVKKTNEKKFKILKRPQIAEAFEAFRTSINEQRVVIHRHRFPMIIQPCLDILESIATAHGIHTDNEYYACINDALGNTLTVPKIKKHLELYRKYVVSKGYKSELETSILQFQTFITSVIQPMPTTSDNDPTTASSSQNNTQTIIQEETLDNADVDKRGDEVKTIYKYRCQWNAQCRVCLLHIENTTNAWIVAENEFRSILTPHAIKDFQLDQAQPQLVEKNEFSKILKRLTEYFPENCSKADVSYLRNMLRTEKKRVSLLKAPKSNNETGASPMMKSSQPSQLLADIEIPSKSDKSPASKAEIKALVSKTDKVTVVIAKAPSKSKSVANKGDSVTTTVDTKAAPHRAPSISASSEGESPSGPASKMRRWSIAPIKSAVFYDPPPFNPSDFIPRLSEDDS